MKEEASERCNIAGFENRGRGPLAKTYGQPLEAENGREMILP